MTATLLHISASPRGANSYSRRYGTMLSECICSAFQCSTVRRDLAQTPPPYPSAEFVEASLGPEACRGDGETTVLQHSDALIAELRSADIVVLDTPMHNFSVPAVLKSWIDHVVRPCRTFRNTPNGKVGLLRDRPVYMILASGGLLSEGTGQSDYLTPYLRYVFGTMGLRRFEAFALDGMLRNAAEVVSKEAAARFWITETVNALALNGISNELCGTDQCA